MPTLASLVAAVRAADLPQAADLSDADIADMVRTAKTAKGAVWLAKRTLGPIPPSEDTVAGRWTTALSCLGKLAEVGDDRAQAMLDAYMAHADTEVDTEH